MRRDYDKTKDWICPYCGVIAFEGKNKLRHLAKHEPAVRKLIRKEFIQNLMLGMQTWDKIESDIEL